MPEHTWLDVHPGDVCAIARTAITMMHRHPNTGGMPDLLLFRHSPAPSAKMVEVKGPRDRLSEAQRAWMRALQHAGTSSVSDV